MWRWIVALLLVTLQPIARPVSAQATTSIDTIEVNIWPEYDREGVLVIYRAALSPDVPLPAAVALRIPRSANAPASLKYEDWDGLLYDLKYDTEVQGDWLLVKFNTPRPDIQLEYYDLHLNIENQQRQYRFVWPGDYAVDHMTLQILQPVHVSEMTFTSWMGNSVQAEDGRRYYSKTVDQIPAGVPLTLSFSYKKPDTAFVATALPVYPVNPITPRTAGRLSWNFLGGLLGILGGLLIAGGIIWFWRSGRALPETARKRSGAAEKKERPEDEIYCRQCGRRASRGDAFCRTCGTKLNE